MSDWLGARQDGRDRPSARSTDPGDTKAEFSNRPIRVSNASSVRPDVTLEVADRPIDQLSSASPASDAAALASARKGLNSSSLSAGAAGWATATGSSGSMGRPSPSSRNGL